MGMSQDEIEKLKEETGDKGEGGANVHSDAMQRVSDLYVKSVENIIPILVGSEKITLEAPKPVMLKFSGLSGAIQDDAVFFVFKIPALSGSHWFGYLGKPLALEISKKMMNQEEGDELTEALVSALVEGFNNVLGAFDNALKEEFGQPAEHADLKFPEGAGLEGVTAETGFDQDTETWALPISLSFDEISGKMGLIVATQCLTDLAGKLPATEAVAAAETVESTPEAPKVEQVTPPEETASGSPINPVASTVKDRVATAQFEPLKPRQTAGAPKGIELILDVPLSVTVELGRKKLSVREILELNPGSLVELEKLAGEAVDLLVNGKLFAKGEVVVIDENFGVRVSSIVTPKERLERIGQ